MLIPTRSERSSWICLTLQPRRLSGGPLQVTRFRTNPKRMRNTCTKLSLRCSKTFRRRCIPEAGDIGAAPRRLHYGDGGRPQRGKSMVDQTVRVAPQAHGSEGRVPARVLIDGRCDEIWFDAPGVLWTQSANPFLAMTLLAAM